MADGMAPAWKPCVIFSVISLSGHFISIMNASLTLVLLQNFKR